MKKTILMAMLIAALEAGALPAEAGLSFVNTTTPTLTTNVTSGTTTIPGVATNLPYVNTSIIYLIGDPLATAFGKINTDLSWLESQIASNATAISWLQLTNGGGGGMGTSTNLAGYALVQVTNIAESVGGAGGSWTNNYLLKRFGVGNDLTISNTFTITSTNVTGYTLTSVTVSGYSNACFNGTFTYNAQLGALSNSCGYLFSGVNESGASVGEIYVLPMGELFQLVSSNFFSAITNVTDYFNTASYNSALTRWEFVGTSSLYFYTNGYPAYTVDAPAVPVNGSSHALYAGGSPALAVGTPIVAYFFLDPATIGNMLTCTFATIQTNLSWVILQPNDTQQADGTYTNYTIAATGAGSIMGTPSTNFFMGVWTCVGEEYQMQSGLGSYGLAGPNGWGSGGCAGVQILDIAFIFCPSQLPCATPTHWAPSSPLVRPVY